MSGSERAEALAMLARKQAGWRRMEEDRREALQTLVTMDALPALQAAFEFANKQPVRMESGFSEFYAALHLGNGRSSA